MTTDEMSVDEMSYCHRNICPNFFSFCRDKWSNRNKSFNAFRFEKTKKKKKKEKQ